MSKALQELKLVILEPREELRLVLMKEWEAKWVFTTKSTQHVVNKSTLNSEELDHMWYSVARECGETLLDQGVADAKSDNTSFTCEVIALRKKGIYETE